MKDKIKGTKPFLATESANTKLSTLLAILACITLPILIYSNALHTPFFYDDIANIAENPDIKQLSNLKSRLIHRSKYTAQRNDPSRPVTFLTLALNYHFGKLDTFGYHMTNLLLHLMNTLLIFFLTRKVLFHHRSKSFDSPPGVSSSSHENGRLIITHVPLLTALLFASHPINTEVVTYISHRSDSLATLFYLMSLLLFSESREGRMLFYPFSLLCFALSLLSKQISATLPAIVLMFDFIFLSDFNVKKVAEKKFYHIPFWAILAAFVAFRYFYLGKIGDPGVATYKTWTSYTYFITQFYVIVNYIKLLLVPYGQSAEHYILPARTMYDPRIVLSVAFLTIFIFSAYKFSKKRQDLSKIILFSIFWFFVTLSPTSSFLPVNDAMVERRLYLPGFGFCLALMLVYVSIFGEFIFPLLLYILILSTLTWNRNKIYMEPTLAWQDVISKYPGLKMTARAHANLGNLYKAQGDYQKSFIEYKKSIDLDPNFTNGYVNLGILYLDQKNYVKSREYFLKALKLNPNSGEAHHNLGLLYKKLRQYKSAYLEFNDAIQFSPSPTDVYNDLGTLFYELKRYEEARQNYELALSLNPDHVSALNNLGILAFENGEYQKAYQIYKKVTALNPGYVSAYLNLGNLYYVQKDFENAELSYRKAVELSPNLAGRIELIKKILDGSKKANNKIDTHFTKTR